MQQKYIWIFSLAGWCFSLFSCTLNPQELHGTWQAVAFYEAGQSVHTPLDSVALEIRPDGQYMFRAQGFYREKGTYRISGRYLFLTDTSATPDIEHAVKVVHLASDSLKIAMEHAGKEQVLFLVHK